MKSFKLPSAVFVLLFLTVLACSLSPSSAPPDPLFSAPADPVNVTVVTDSSRAVTQLVSTNGGTLTATASDGSQFTLWIPADALLAETQITMTPVKSIAGLPFQNGMVAAVQLSPEGLFLYKDAILTIQPVKKVPLQNQILFGYLGTGRDLSLAIPGPESQKIQVRIMHFCGWGLGSGIATDRATLLLKRAADHEVRLQQEIANYLKEYAQKERNEPGSTDAYAVWNTIEQHFNSYYGLVVRPRILAAGSSCDNGMLAINSVQGFQRQGQVLTGDSTYLTDQMVSNTDVGNLLKTVYAKCRQEKITSCKKNVDFTELLNFENGFERLSQLLGYSSMENSTNKVSEAVSICGGKPAYELSFASPGTIFTPRIICHFNQLSQVQHFLPSPAGNQTDFFQFTPAGSDGLNGSVNVNTIVKVGDETITTISSNTYSITPTAGCTTDNNGGHPCEDYLHIPHSLVETETITAPDVAPYTITSTGDMTATYDFYFVETFDPSCK